MGDKPGYDDEVNIAFTKDLIGDAYIAVLGIMSFYWFHLSPFPFFCNVIQKQSDIIIGISRKFLFG
jgi:hypothetical protein